MSDTDLTDFKDGQDPFATGDVFANRKLVRVGHVPSNDRIVGRDEEINDVGGVIGPAINGDPPRNSILYGKTGTGKSLVSRYLAGWAEERAAQNDVNLVHAYIDCSDSNTPTRIARQMTKQVEAKVEKDADIPLKGIGDSEYLNHYLYDLLEEVDTFLVILDEIDIMKNDDILMQLSRAEESGKTECFVGTLAISNKINYRERLNKRIDSSLREKEFTFDPYDATQIRDILNRRTDAFEEGVLNDDVIPKIAALVAREHGDARKAVDMLFEAGCEAEENNDDAVTVEHIEAAKERTEIKRFKETISGFSPHGKYILYALALLAEDRKPDSFSTSKINEMYQSVAKRENSDPLKMDTVYRKLDEMEFLGITSNTHTGDGFGSGSHLTHTLNRDSEIVIEALQDKL